MTESAVLVREAEDSDLPLSIDYNPSRRWLLVPLAVFALSLALLWWHAAPSVTFHDGGEFAMAAASAGNPHPPCAPTWTALASAFVRLGGFSDPARGTNLFSGLWGAVTLALLCGVVQYWASRLFPLAPKWVPAAAGLVSALVLLHSWAFIEQATTTEQYTLLTALLIGMLAAATAIPAKFEGDCPHCEKLTVVSRTRLAALLGLLWGLAIGNHLSQISLVFLVVWAVWVGAGRHARLRGALRVGGSAAAGTLCGLLIFLWVPIRSRANPLIDWGHVQSFERFIWAISRQQWETRSIGEAPPGFIREWMASYDPVGQLGIVGFLLCAVGLIVLAKRGKLWLGWLAACSVPYTAGMLWGHLRQASMDIPYLTLYKVVDWHLPVYAVCAAAAGVGTAFALQFVSRSKLSRLGLGIGVAVAFGLAASALLVARQNSLRNWRAPDEFVSAVLAPLPPDAVIIPGSDNLCFMLGYHVNIARPESKRWLAFRYTSLAGVNPKARADGLCWSEKDKVHYLRETLLDPNWQPMRVKPLSVERAKRARVFTNSLSEARQDAAYLLPVGFLFEIKGRPTTDQEVRESERRWRRQFPHLFKSPDPKARRLEAEAWARLHWQRGAFFLERGMWPEAVESSKHAISWVDTVGEIWFGLAYCLDRMGRLEDAEKAYLRALVFDPCSVGVRTNLAGLYACTGHYDHAERLLVEALNLRPNDKAIKSNLALVRKQMRR